LREPTYFHRKVLQSENLKTMKKNRPLLFLPFFLLFYISQINGYDGTSINNLSTALPISGETICLNSEFCLSDTTNFVKDTVMVDIAILQVPCFGEANGSLQASLSGGNPGYNFSWLDKDNEVINNNTLILKNAEAGVYKISGTDADNRAFEASIILPSIPEIQISFADIRGPSCFNPGFSERDGAATALVNYADGSTGSFTFFWPTGQVEIGSESRVSNLGSGQIEVLVFETNGICSSKSSVVIPSPEQLVYDTVNSIVTPVTCFGNGDGSILVSAKGGTGPYTYLWDYEN